MISPDPSLLAQVLALTFVGISVAGAFFFVYTAIGIVEPIDNFLPVNLTGRVRYLAAGLLFGALAVIQGLWPLDVYETLTNRMGVVEGAFAGNGPGVKIGLDGLTWSVSAVPDQAVFAIEILFVILVISVVIRRFTTDEGGRGIPFRWAFGVQLAAVTLSYVIASLIGFDFFPIDGRIALVIQVLSVLAVLYALTRGVSYFAVHVARFFSSLHVRYIPEHPPRYQVITGALAFGVFLAVYPTSHAVLVWLGVLVYIAGGGWRMFHIMAGYEPREREYCWVPEGREDQMCEVRTEWIRGD